MGRTRIKVDLTHDGLIEAQRAIMRYKDELRYKCELFLDRLAEYGIHEAVFAASGDQDNYGNYLSFRKDISDTADGVQCILVVTSDIIKSEWKTGPGDGETKSADVSPLLMLEFGAGLLARNPDANKFGMGTGTFPGQTHAEDPRGWYYQTLDGRWHHSYGHEARMPVQKAADEMIRQVRHAAKEVFG